jgi:hypothetical protein
MKSITSVIYNAVNVFTCGAIRLIPGANNLSRYDDGEVKKFLDHPNVKAKIQSGVIKVDKLPANDSGQLPVKEAIELIKKNLNRQELREMLESEDRPSVIKAINGQLKILDTNKPEEKPGAGPTPKAGEQE